MSTPFSFMDRRSVCIRSEVAILGLFSAKKPPVDSFRFMPQGTSRFSFEQQSSGGNEGIGLYDVPFG